MKWFAERADLILLFFDPDKPGTTGETLKIYTNTLSGMHHKYRIILNKADQFKKMHDFARAYGSLCWNLSKVIPRKDLPPIHTMCLPPSYTNTMPTNDTTSQGGKTDDELFGLGSALNDLLANLDDVIGEVHKVPQKRVHNLITRLNDAALVLRMHSRLLTQIRTTYRSRLMRLFGTMSLVGILSGGIAIPLFMEGFASYGIGAGGMGLVAMGGVYFWGSKDLDDLRQTLVSPEGLQAMFNKEYAIEISKRDESSSAVWFQVKDFLTRSLANKSLSDIPSISNSDIKALDRIVDKEVPELRRKVSQQHLSQIRRNTGQRGY